ncbi:hypothetical protein [Bordetella sp. 02P26C-1]|uniref:hypothetical protein n=1 Tax=Bordetella sp. 02P26C-1 TaxID=2683195 RepID=UPI0013536050|nr:hypothetical protein [Bordetella sp. 02P26C-1]MVW79119.1 hypothetical protein [Bordetella sp. 02P26C-1]
MSPTPLDNPIASPKGDQRRSAAEEEMLGTGKMPMPEDTPVVAGQPRDGRVLTEPGNPGIITPEDDELVNTPSDESKP